MDAKISMIISDICVKKNRFIITDDNMVHSESLLLFVIFVKTKRCCYSKKATTYLYVQYTIVFFGDTIDDLKTVTVPVTVLFTGFIFSIRDSQVILIAGVSHLINRKFPFEWRFSRMTRCPSETF